MTFLDFYSQYILDFFINVHFTIPPFRTFGRLVSTYESASIRRFRAGRVDNIRACTSDTLQWARAMVDPDASVKTLLLT